MNNKFFQVKVQFDRTPKMGEELTSSKPELYLVDALSFTEAEAMVIKAVTPFAVGGVEVKAENKSSISEIVDSNDPRDDRWYKARVDFLTLDNDKEKHTPVYYLVKAIDFKGALTHLEETGMNGICGDYVIISLAETAIVDVLRTKTINNPEQL